MKGGSGETLVSWLQPLVDRLIRSKRFDSERCPKVIENSIKSGISYAIAGVKGKADRLEILLPYCGDQLHLLLRFVWNKPERISIDGVGDNYDEVSASSGFFIDWERIRSKWNPLKNVASLVAVLLEFQHQFRTRQLELACTADQTFQMEMEVMKEQHPELLKRLLVRYKEEQQKITCYVDIEITELNDLPPALLPPNRRNDWNIVTFIFKLQQIPTAPGYSPKIRRQNDVLMYDEVDLAVEGSKGRITIPPWNDGELIADFISTFRDRIISRCRNVIETFNYKQSFVEFLLKNKPGMLLEFDPVNFRRLDLMLIDEESPLKMTIDFPDRLNDRSEICAKCMSMQAETSMLNSVISPKFSDRREVMQNVRSKEDFIRQMMKFIGDQAIKFRGNTRFSKF